MDRITAFVGSVPADGLIPWLPGLFHRLLQNDDAQGVEG
jgi:hypothetical protein